MAPWVPTLVSAALTCRDPEVVDTLRLAGAFWKNLGAFQTPAFLDRCSRSEMDNRLVRSIIEYAYQGRLDSYLEVVRTSNCRRVFGS